MQPRPLRTTVVGSYRVDRFRKADLEELLDDAVTVVATEQTAAGLDVITDPLTLDGGWSIA